MTAARELRKLSKIIDRFSKARVLVVGDVMIDHYIWGTVSRISPEAPVPVVNVTRENLLLGAAANVVNNIRALGGEVGICGVIGHDDAGKRLQHLLHAQEIPTDGLIADPGRTTTIKTRVIAHHQQVVRFDREKLGPHPAEVQRAIAAFLKDIWPRIDAVVISDYGKGLVQGALMDRIRTLNRGKSMRPIAVDPKSSRFELYRRATVITPNLAEALAAARMTGGHLEQTVERAALAALKAQGRHSRLPTDVTPERVQHLEQELSEKTQALAELSVAFTLLEKKEREGFHPGPPARRLRQRHAQ